MCIVRQKVSNESENIENKKRNRKPINLGGGVDKTYLNTLVGKLKSKRIIVMICLVSLTFMVIPVIPLLLAFLAGRWLKFKSKKSF